MAVDGQPAAEREHADEAERRDRGQRGVVPGGEPDHPQPGAEQVLARRLHPLHLLLFLAEPLDHADPADGLVDDPGDLADLAAARASWPGTASCATPWRSARAPGATATATSESSGDRVIMMTSEKTNSSRLPRISGIHCSRPCTMLMSEIDRPTSWPVWISSCRAPSSRDSELEQLGPHGVLHVERHLAAAVPPHVDADEVGRPRRSSSPIASGQTDSLARDDHVVDDRPLQQRDRQRRRDIQHRPRQRDNHVPLEPPAVAGQPPDPASLIALLAAVVFHPPPTVWRCPLTKTSNNHPRIFISQTNDLSQ